MILKKQNILFLTRTMALGGTENVILQLCEVLKNEVNNIVVCSCGGINEKKLREMNIEHVKINDIENKNIINIIKNIKIVKKIIKDKNITIIHSHHRMAAMYANIVTNKKIIKIANAHNTFWDKKVLTKLSYANTQIIAVGEQVKKNLVDFYKIPKKRVNVIYNAVKPFDGNVIIDNELKEAKENGYTIISNVGRLSEQKGMEYFIEAADIINKKNQKIKYYIIGSGEKEEDLKQMVQKKKLDDYIKFMGFRADVQNIMSQSDLIVLSSLWEGLPLTPIEAFSVGKTIVATSVDGTVEIVKNKENGLLVEPRNVNELSSAICELVENESEKKRFEENAIKTYKEKFSFEIFRENYIKFYKNIKDE
ncbi:glycosyltransferase family 1 protein [bacterium]|nr:glycosyltransferase family 1 protein [bacterium]